MGEFPRIDIGNRMSVIRPDFLKKGDLVLIIGISRARSEAQLAEAMETLLSWGLKVEAGAHLYSRFHQFAGTDDERAADLQWAVSHPVAKAVIFAGGGYGAMRVIDRVVFGDLSKHPKWFAGYSDATTVFNRLWHENVAAIHSTMAFQFPVNIEATESLRMRLFGEKREEMVPVSSSNRMGLARAQVVGGNLSLIYALSGSRDDLQTNGKILFIEDLDEQLYHLDRMMLQLKRSGKLSKLAGLVVGGLSDMKDNSIPYGASAEEIVREAVAEYQYPVCFGYPAGHVERNMALYLNCEAELEVNEKQVRLNYLL